MNMAQPHQGQRKPWNPFTYWSYWILKRPGLKSGWCVLHMRRCFCVFICFFLVHIMSHVFYPFPVCPPLPLSARILQQDCGSPTPGEKIQVSGERFTHWSISLTRSFCTPEKSGTIKKQSAEQAWKVSAEGIQSQNLIQALESIALLSAQKKDENLHELGKGRNLEQSVSGL